MCLIIAKPAGKTVPSEWVRSAANSNKDSLGVAYYDEKGRQRIHKWVKPNKERIESAIKLIESLSDRPVLIHFRWTTHGKTNEANCHPFPLTKDAVIAHNGVICGYQCPENEHSDTVLYIRKNILPFVQEYGYKAVLPHLDGLYKDDIGSSKLCALTKDGEFFYANECLGTWKDGMWLSNTHSINSRTKYDDDAWDGYNGTVSKRWPTGDWQDREWHTNWRCWVKKDMSALWDFDEGVWISIALDEDSGQYVCVVDPTDDEIGISAADVVVETVDGPQVYNPFRDNGVLVPENTPALPARCASSALYPAPPMSDGVAKVGTILPTQSRYRGSDGKWMVYSRLTGRYEPEPYTAGSPSSIFEGRRAGFRQPEQANPYEQALLWQLCPDCGLPLSSDNYCLECRHTVHSRGLIAGPPMPLDKQMMMELNSRLREAETTDPVHLG